MNEEYPKSQSGGPKLVFLLGASGSGKSRVGERLSQRLAWKFVDTDNEIVRAIGQTINDIFEQHGETFFREQEQMLVKTVLETSEPTVIATGGGLPAIPGLINKLQDGGMTIYLRASVAELWKRLTVDPRELDARPLLRRRGRLGLEEQMRKRDSIYSCAQHTLVTDDLGIDDVVSQLISIICTPDTLTNNR